MKSNGVLRKNDGTALANPITYKTLVGSLQYCVITRQEIALLVSKFWQFRNCLTDVHLVAVKRV